MAYNVSVYGAPDWGRTGTPGFDDRPTLFAVPAGGPVPNIQQTRKPYLNTRPSLPELESAAKAKKLFQPKRNVLARHKLAYALGVALGKSAAYPLQENTPQHETVPNTLPPHVPPTKGIPGPKIVWPSSRLIPIKRSPPAQTGEKRT